MATIHKLKKAGSTIYPATITDAVVHQDTGATLTEMINLYNVSQLFPTSGEGGSNTYTLEGALTVLVTYLTAEEKVSGIHVSYIDSENNDIQEYIYQGGTFTSVNSWNKAGDIHSTTFESSVVEELNFDPYSDTLHITPQIITEEQRTQVLNNLNIPDYPDFSEFVTKTVDDLVNYYTKSETYSKTEVNTLIESIRQFTYVIVDSLPTASEETMYKLYLVPNKNVKDEYITLQYGNTYAWQLIGSTEVDLSGYSTTEQMNQAISNALENYYTKSEVNTLIENLDQFKIIIADSLPTASADTMRKLYFIPSTNPGEHNIKNEFVTLYREKDDEITYFWEQIGSSTVDLINYPTKQEMNTALSQKANSNEVYSKNETYNKSEVNSMITTPNQNYITVDDYASLPASGSSDTIYRVSNWNGTSVDTSSYSEYAWDGNQYVLLSVKSQIGEVFDISAYHATGSGLAKYANLSAALGTNGANIPESIRKGGMSIKFVLSSDNKYVEYFYKLEYENTTAGNNAFVNPDNWEKINLGKEVSQLGQEIDANYKDITDLTSAVSNGNAGFIRANGTIAPSSSYPASRYTNPIHLYPGDVIYIKANVGTTNVAVFTECDSAGDNRNVITTGVSGVSTFRYVATKEVYIIISTYLSTQVASGIWLQITNNTAQVLYNKAMSSISGFANFDKLGNNIWATNPEGNAATLDNIQVNATITRRMCYSCIRWAKFYGLDKTIKRTIYILWNGYAGNFRIAISKYDTDAAQWVSEFDTNNIPINNINPNHNAVIPVTIGNSVKLLVDTSLFGYYTLSTIINPIGTSEPEFIFSEECYEDIPTVDTGGLKVTIPSVYPNALLPCVSFQFDDNDANDELVVALFDELGLRCNFAFIASEANITALGDKYLGWHHRGYGICSHSVDSKIFNTDNYTTAADALAALQTSKNRLAKKGFVVNGFVSPSSQMADAFLDLVKDTYGYAFTSNDGYSGQRRGNPCLNVRQNMQSLTLAQLKQKVDVAITYGYNFTFYGHSANFGTTYSGEEWNIAKLRAILEYAISKRDDGLLFIGNTDECMYYFYGGNLYNEHFSGVCGTIQPKNRYHYYLHNVTSATIAYNANLPAECEIMLETDASYTSGITFGSGYKFASVPTFGAGETWYIKIIQGCVIATKMV